jgi:hypothetical protein
MASILAAACAPAVVRSGILMPVKKIYVPEHGIFTPSVVDDYEDGFLSNYNMQGTYTRIGNIVSLNMRIVLSPKEIKLESKLITKDEFDNTYLPFKHN